MVGKAESNSRIFHQCYVKYCKMQNLTPLNAVMPSNQGKVLDFCVDRIKYADWPPILNALSCDLSLHSVSIRCRQPIKTVLEHIDSESLAKTVNKRAVILTNFMLSNLTEALSQLLSDTTLLNSLLLEGLPLKIPYLNPLNEAILTNSSLQHLYLPRCQIGDAGCLALCKAVRCLPNIETLDLTGCDIGVLGASYIAELVKYQKIHRYSENWVHTLRYRLPELDTMAGLRRITLCSNPLGDAGATKLLEVLADDLWIKALDLQNCNLTNSTAAQCLHTLSFNNTLVVLDLRHNSGISSESIAEVRNRLRQGNERNGREKFSWLTTVSGSTDRLVKTSVKNGVVRERTPAPTRATTAKYTPKPATGPKKDQQYLDDLTEQLAEEVSHRRQLEQLNLQLVQQMKQLKQQHMRLWTAPASSGSEGSLGASSHSADVSSTGSTTVTVDQNTLAYIQQAFKDIYDFIKNNQCHGECQPSMSLHPSSPQPTYSAIEEVSEQAEYEMGELRVNIAAKKAQSAHEQLTGTSAVRKKGTQSAHKLGDSPKLRDIDMKPDMIERQMGDTKDSVYLENQNLLEYIIEAQNKMKSGGGGGGGGSASSSGSGSSSSGTVRGRGAAAAAAAAPNPRRALDSSSDSDDTS